MSRLQQLLDFHLFVTFSTVNAEIKAVAETAVSVR